MESITERRTQESNCQGPPTINRTLMDDHGFDKDEKYDGSFTELIRPDLHLQTRSEVFCSDLSEDENDQRRPQDLVNVPVEIHYSPGEGRYLVAWRDISAGEVIFKESPLLLAPKPGSAPVCLSCLKALDNDLVLCEECGGTLCSSNCNGGGHLSDECGLIKCLGLERASDIKASFKELSVLLAPLRMYLLMEDDPVAKEVINALESHKESRSMLPIGRFIEEKIVSVFQSKLGLDVDSATVHHLCGALDTNSYEVSLDGSSRVRAVFTMASMLNHSCLPNAQRWHDEEGQMVVRAASDIRKGTPVTMTYTQTLWGTSSRLAHLSACKMFTCTCDRCADPTEFGSHLSSISCKSCRDPNIGLLLPPTGRVDLPWKCHNCGAEFPASAIQTMVRAASGMLSRVDTADREESLATLRHLSGMLGNQHYIVAQLKYAIIQALMEEPLSDATADDDLVFVMQSTEELLQLAQRIEPELSRFRGLLLLHRGQAFLELMKRHHKRQNDLRPEEEEHSVMRGSPKPNGYDLSQRYVEEMMGRMAECEYILLYDPRLPDVTRLTQQLKQHHSKDHEERDEDFGW